MVSGHCSKIRATAAADSVSASVRSGFLSSIQLFSNLVCTEKADAAAGRPCAQCRSAKVRAFSNANGRQVAFVDDVPIGPLAITVSSQNGKQCEAGQSSSAFISRSPYVSHLKIPDAHERESKESGRHCRTVNPVFAVT